LAKINELLTLKCDWQLRQVSTPARIR